MGGDDDFNLDDLDTLTFESLDEIESASEDSSKYGVWVKSGPIEVTEDEGPVGQTSSTSPDFPEEDFLSSEELAGLEETVDLSVEPSPSEEGLDDFDGLQADATVEASSGQNELREVELDEFISFEDYTQRDEEPDVPTSQLAPEGQEDEEFLDIDIEVSDTLSDDEIEIFEGAQIQHDYPSQAEASSASGEGVDFSSEFDKVLAEEKSAEWETTTSPSVAPTPEESPAVRTTAEQSLAEMILKKIEAELASIKAEIHDLKARLEQVGHPLAEETVRVEGEKEPAKGGFFSDDEDEVIALTGDELNNILSSAEVTSELGQTQEPFESTPGGEDLITYDETGEITSEPASSDIDLLQGTEFESALGEEVEIPNYPVTAPAGAETPEAEAGVPDSIALEEAPLPDLGDEEPDLSVGPSAEEEEANLDLLGQELGDIPSETAIPQEEIDFTQPQSLPESLQVESMEMVDQIEDVTESFFGDVEGGVEAEENEPALEIPFDDELLTEEDSLTSALESSSEDLGGLDSISVGAEESSSVDAIVDEVLPPPPPPQPSGGGAGLSEKMKEEIKSVLAYMDKLLASLPDDKIQEFAESEHFEVYKRLFEELGLTES